MIDMDSGEIEITTRESPIPVSHFIKPIYESLYKDIKYFNIVQRRVFPTLYNTDDNVIVAAPNGNGKGVCAEFSILRNHTKSSLMRVVYIAPLKSLVMRRYCEWEKKFARGLGLTVVELKGEVEADLMLVKHAQIIISNPENWDALCMYSELIGYFQEQVSLFIIDDLHLIGNPGGEMLEAIVSRMRYISRKMKNKIRIVALATSLANTTDLGEWIGASSHNIFNFPPGVRHVPLDLHIQGVDLYNFGEAMQALTKLTLQAICIHVSNGQPAIVYVPTHTHVILTAYNLVIFATADSKEKSIILLDSLELQSCTFKVKDPNLKSTLRCGVGFLHEGLCSTDRNLVSCLFKDGHINMCVVTSAMCWEVQLSAHLVVVMGTRYYDAGEEAHFDYPVTDLLQMIGHAGRPMVDKSGKAVILSHTPQKEHYKKFLHEALPVESYLQTAGLYDIFNSNIVAGIIRDKEDALNFISWTYLYRRLTAHPTFYHVKGITDSHVSSFLLGLVENTLNDLEGNRFLAVDKEDYFLYPRNLAFIATQYYVSCTTIGLFSTRLSSNVTLKRILRMLSSASEYSHLPVRFGEKVLIRHLSNQQRFHDEDADFSNAHTKASVLLQAHLSRLEVVDLLANDQVEVLITASRLLFAMVDVIALHGRLNSTLLVIELSQMITQGLWDTDSTLLQVPHFTRDLAKRCRTNPGNPVESVFDLLEMEDDARKDLLQMSDLQYSNAARFCNCYPDMDISYDIVDYDNIRSRDNIKLTVSIVRNLVDGLKVGVVDARRYPAEKQEHWWLIVGDTETNQLLSIKKIRLL